MERDSLNKNKKALYPDNAISEKEEEDFIESSQSERSITDKESSWDINQKDLKIDAKDLTLGN